MSEAHDFIPFALPDVGDEEAQAVAEAVKSGWITSGPSMRSLEREFSQYVGGDVESVAVSSATAGLHLALEALNVGPGDEIIIPTWTFTATAEVVRYVGATPVIVDVDPLTLNMSLESVKRAISPRTKVVIPVHMAGLPVDMASFSRLLAGSGVSLVEDAAHALPAVGTDNRVGSVGLSAACVFSFYATKTVTTGEGGMLTTRDPDIAARARIMRLHGIDRDSFNRYSSVAPGWFYDVVAPGYKYNMTDLAAAMGRVQLRRSDAMHRRRTRIAQMYREAFTDLPVQLPAEAPEGQVHAWHLFIVRLLDEAGIDRGTFIKRMSDRSVATSVHFIPLHEHTYWKPYAPDPLALLPNAVAQAPRAVSLPLSSRMTDGQVNQVIEAVTGSLK